MIINMLKDCGKSSQDRSRKDHKCLESLKSKRVEDRKNLLIILDFLTEKMVLTKDFFAGNTGQLLKKITNEFSEYNTEITVAIKCFQKYDNTKIVAEDFRVANNHLISEIKYFQPDLIICFGEKAVTTLFGKQQKISDHRNKFVKGKGMVCSTTFSLLAPIIDPNKEKEILKDILFIKQKWNDATKPLAVDYRVIGKYDAYEIQNIFALDIETTGLNPFEENAKILTLAVSDSEGKALGFNISHPDHPFGVDGSNVLAPLQDENSLMIGHNIKFDALWMREYLNCTIKCQLFDTKIAYILLDENSPSNTLKYLAANLTDLPTDYAIDTKKLIEQPFDKVILYNMQDSDATFRVYKILVEQLKEKGKIKLMSFLMDVLKTLLEIEYNGIDVDVDLMSKQEEKLKNNLKLKKENFDSILVNPDSPKQLCHLLFERYNLPILYKTEKGQPSVNDFALKQTQKLNNISKECKYFIDMILEWRKESKFYKTFYLGMKDYIINGKIHTIYNLGKSSNYADTSGTVTGRLSSNNPNLQNIPRKGNIRELFIAPKGYKWLDADYSQLEMRVAGWFSKEDKLIQYFKDGKDFHTSVFSELIKRDYHELQNILSDKTHKEYSELKNRRVVVKSINFGILYGAGADMVKQLCDKENIPITKDECQEMIDKWLRAYPKLTKWIAKTKKQALETGVVSSPTGRDRHLIGVNRGDAKSFALLRQAVNFPIQTLASEICLAALVLLNDTFKELNLDSKIVLTVHDSVGIIFNQNIDQVYLSNLVEKVMTQLVPQYFYNQFGFKFDVPLSVDINISDRWS